MAKKVHIYIRDEAEYDAIIEAIRETEVSFSGWVQGRIHDWFKRTAPLTALQTAARRGTEADRTGTDMTEVSWPDLKRKLKGEEW